MASNVFGIPVTTGTLQGMTEYHDKSITAADRARVAMEMKNAEGKDTNARDFAENIQKNATEGIMVLIYNATGNRLTLAGASNNAGLVNFSPYPSVLENGQWGVFLHSRYGASGSVGQVAYAGTNSFNSATVWATGWNQWTPDGQTNFCHVQIRQGNTFTAWNDLYNATRNGKASFHQASGNNGCLGFASIGSGTNGALEIVLTLS